MENKIVMEHNEQSFIETEKKKFNDYINSAEYKEKLITRLKVISATQNNAHHQLYALHLCKEDPVFFIQNFGWTYDPRPQHSLESAKAGGNLPFILFEYQVAYIHWLVDCIKNGKDGFIEKSRDMGATWIMAWVMLWFWRFGEGFSGHLGSRKEELVDNRTRDSLFGMIDYSLQSLPDWMLPNRFNSKKHRMHLKLINPENLNLLTGESMNPDFSRQSRKTVVIFDELAFWEYAQEAWDSAGDTTSCRIGISTPNGRNFASLLRERIGNILTLHWKLHPLKDQVWYEFQRQRRTEEEVAQELDISYQKSQEGRVYPEWDTVDFGTYFYDSELPLYISWDYGQTDDTAIIWWQKENSGKWHIIDCYWNRSKTIDFYIPFVTGVISSDSYRYSKKDLDVIKEHNNWKKGVHFGDPSGRFTNQVVNKSVFEVLSDNGIYVNFREEAKDFQSRKTASKLLMRNLVVNKNVRTEYLSICMSNAAYPQVRDRGVETVKSIKPKHDFTSHLRSSFEYGAVNFEAMNFGKKIIDKFSSNKFNQLKSGRRTIGY